MNVFHKVALQGLLKSRTRTVVTIVGVMLSTAMFTAIATFGTSLVQYMINVEIAKGGSWHIVFSGVALSELQQWESDEEVAESAVFENIGYAVLEGAGEKKADKPYLFVAGFRDETYDALPVTMISGRLPANRAEVIVPANSIAAVTGIRFSEGDVLTLAVGDRAQAETGAVLTQSIPYTEGETLVHTTEKTYTVVGTFERPGFEIHPSAGYTVITKADEGNPAGSCSFYAALKNPRSVQDYADGKSAESPYTLNEGLLRFMGVSDNKIFNALLFTVGGVLAAIVMTGSVFLIYNSFHISLNERVHQFGILMSVGATGKQLQESVLFEGICIGIVGIPLGVLLGIVSIWLLLPVVSQTFANILNSKASLTLAVSVPILALSAVLSLITILISAYIPAKKAVSTPVMECIRQTNDIKMEAKAVKTGKSAWKRYGLEGTLALKNFKRNKKRYRSIVLSLTLSVILTVTGNAFSTALKQIGGAYTAEQADGDIMFSTQAMSEEQFLALYDKIKDVDGVYRSSWQADPVYLAEIEDFPEDFLTSYRAAMGDDSTGSAQQFAMYCIFIEDDIFYEYVDRLGLPREEYSGEDAKVFLCVMDAQEHNTFFAGTSMNVTLMSSSGGETKTICATFEDDYPLDSVQVLDGTDVSRYVFTMTAPLSMKPQFDAVDTVDGGVLLGALLWSSAPEQTLSAVQAVLTDEGVTRDYMLFNLSQAFGTFRNLTFVIDVFTYIFVFMISLIAVANVFNTISTNIRLRRRELAMLRSVGMSDRSFNSMMRFECAFYGIRTLLYGVPAATLLSWMIHKVIMSIEEVDEAFRFPWAAMGISVLGVFCIVFITMMYAVSKIKKENIIDALRDDNA